MPSLVGSEMCIRDRFHFMLGTMVYTMANPGRIQALTAGACDPTDMDAALAYLVPFLAQGFEANPIPETSIDVKPVRKTETSRPKERVS